MLSIPSNRARRALQITLAAGVSFGASQTSAELLMHLDIPGIPGESTYYDHKGQIVVLEFDEKLDGKKSCPEYTITKFLDKSSPPLADAVNKGTSLSAATLTMRKSGEGQKDFYKITMTNVSVLSVRQTVANSDGAGIERLVISPKVVNFDYKPQDEKGGLGGAVLSTISCP